MENDVNSKVEKLKELNISSWELKELRRVLVGSIKKIDRILTNPHATDKFLEDRILDGVCRYYGITLQELRRYKRKPELVQRRQVSVYLLRAHTNMTLSQVGRAVGYKCHATVLHHINEVSDKLSDDFYSDKRFKKTYQNILNYLEL